MLFFIMWTNLRKKRTEKCFGEEGESGLEITNGQNESCKEKV